MAEQERLADDETVVRWVDRSDPHKFQPPDRVTSGNFKERSGERGLSVFRISCTSLESVLRAETRGKPSEYLFVAAAVGRIRALARESGQSFDLDVVADDDDGKKPGHALIIGKITKGASDALRDLFNPLTVVPSNDPAP